MQYEVVVFADAGGAALSNASNVTITGGVMTFLDAGGGNAIVTDDTTSATALSITDGTLSFLVVNGATDTLELPQDVDIGTSAAGKTLDFLSSAIRRSLK